MKRENLLTPEATLLAADAAAAELDAGRAPLTVVRAHPESSLAWAMLAEATLEDAAAITLGGGSRAAAAGKELEAYAYARVGYHRGLDALRKAGWRGSGPVPYSHEPNRGVLRALYALRRAAELIGETHEAKRLNEFLADSDPTAVAQICAAVAPAATAAAAQNVSGQQHESGPNNR